MEAPEKIYISAEEEYKFSKSDSEIAWSYKPPFDFIEYTRTDAFIEKACDFFEENIEEEDCKIGSSEWTELRAEYKSLNSFIRAFVKYMKGE